MVSLPTRSTSSSPVGVAEMSRRRAAEFGFRDQWDVFEELSLGVDPLGVVELGLFLGSLGKRQVD